MNDKKFMRNCFTCGSVFQFGPHVYEGKHIPSYNITVCKGCYEGNWDGWLPDYEQKIVNHLKENNIPVPEKNNNGWLPRD